jgi:hypothetical protein
MDPQLTFNLNEGAAADGGISQGAPQQHNPSSTMDPLQASGSGAPSGHPAAALPHQQQPSSSGAQQLQPPAQPRFEVMGGTQERVMATLATPVQAHAQQPPAMPVAEASALGPPLPAFAGQALACLAQQQAPVDNQLLLQQPGQQPAGGPAGLQPPAPQPLLNGWAPQQPEQATAPAAPALPAAPPAEASADALLQAALAAFFGPPQSHAPPAAAPALLSQALAPAAPLAQPQPSAPAGLPPAKRPRLEQLEDSPTAPAQAQGTSQQQGPSFQRPAVQLPDTQEASDGLGQQQQQEEEEEGMQLGSPLPSPRGGQLKERKARAAQAGPARLQAQLPKAETVELVQRVRQSTGGEGSGGRDAPGMPGGCRAPCPLLSRVGPQAPAVARPLTAPPPSPLARCVALRATPGPHHSNPCRPRHLQGPADHAAGAARAGGVQAQERAGHQQRQDRAGGHRLRLRKVRACCWCRQLAAWLAGDAPGLAAGRPCEPCSWRRRPGPPLLHCCPHSLQPGATPPSMVYHPPPLCCPHRRCKGVREIGLSQFEEHGGCTFRRPAEYTFFSSYDISLKSLLALVNAAEAPALAQCSSCGAADGELAPCATCDTGGRRLWARQGQAGGRMLAPGRVPLPSQPCAAWQPPAAIHTCLQGSCCPVLLSAPHPTQPATHSPRLPAAAPAATHLTCASSGRVSGDAWQCGTCLAQGRAWPEDLAPSGDRAGPGPATGAIGMRLHPAPRPSARALPRRLQPSRQPPPPKNKRALTGPALQQASEQQWCPPAPQAAAARWSCWRWAAHTWGAWPTAPG